MRSKVNIPFLIALITLLVIGGAMYYYFLATDNTSEAPNLVQQALPESDDMFVRLPEETAPPQPTTSGNLSTSATAFEFGEVMQDKRATLSTIIRAQSFPARFKNIQVPLSAQNGLTLDYDCDITTQLQPDTSCTVQVSWSPSSDYQSINANLIVEAATTDSIGQPKIIALSVPITGTVKEKPVNHALAEKVVTAPPPKDTKPKYSRAALRAIEARRRPVGNRGTIVTYQENNTPLDKDENWSDLGIEVAESTLPVDMSRTLLMGEPISAALTRPIDARHDSELYAVVTRDIYASGKGRKIIIPRGSRIVGRTEAISNQNQEKVPMVIQHITRPDGARFLVEASGADAMGRTGGLPKANNREWERYGFLGIKTGLSAVATLLLGGSQEVAQNGDSATIARDSRAQAADIIANDLQAMADDYLDRRADLPPLRDLPVGSRITVFPNLDLVMKKKRSPNQQSEDDPASTAYQNAVRGAQQQLPANTQQRAQQSSNNRQPTNGRGQTPQQPVDSYDGNVWQDLKEEDKP